MTISTSFEPYLFLLSQNPKCAIACKASMKARQNVSRGILSSTPLRKNGCPLKKRDNQTFFHKRTIERLCASDDHKSEITEILDLCDYDYIVSVKNIFLFCVFFT